MNIVHDKQIRTLSAQIVDLFSIDSTYQHAGQLTLYLSYRYHRSKSQKLLHERLKLAGYDYSLKDNELGLILQIDPKPKLRIPRLNIILFLCTILSVYIVPILIFKGATATTWSEAWAQTLNDLADGRGLVFTVAIMSILLVHEMAHFVAGRRRGIITSWPYFIPAPNIIGSFGAIIKSKSPFWNRRDLIEVGAAGPIAGWIVAIVWLVWGMSDSYVLYPGMPLPDGLVFILEGESLLIQWLVPMMIGELPLNSAYVLSEAAFAGWVGLFITAINMLPIGQLDGGHVMYGLFGRRQSRLGWITMVGLIWLGSYSPVWWFFAAMGLVFRVKHPPTLEDHRPISKVAFWMGMVAIVIFVISFTPIPFR